MSVAIQSLMMEADVSAGRKTTESSPDAGQTTLTIPTTPVLLRLEEASEEESEESSEEEDEALFSTTWWDKYVITLSNKYRRIWNVILFFILVYTGTVMPFTLCFINFHFAGDAKQDEAGVFMEQVVDLLFWFDLFVNFLFSYEDKHNREIKSFELIVRHYLSGYFILNLIACTPERLLQVLLDFAFNLQDESSKQVADLGHLARLTRLTRLLKLAHSGLPADGISREGMRGFRVANFFFGLVWSVHFLACGWYVCAYLHPDHSDTWVARRNLADGTALINCGPVEQWTHSMYFVLTLFTTVGFGDIVPQTTGEVAYVCVAMIVGTVVNGIILSEVIGIITSIDDSMRIVVMRKELITQFAKHTSLTDDIRVRLFHWIDAHSSSRVTCYDREAATSLLVSKLPRSIMELLPTSVFHGKLVVNSFVNVCRSRTPKLPLRFPLLIALAADEHHYNAGEVMFQLHDHPFNLYLVLQGTMANVAPARAVATEERNRRAARHKLKHADTDPLNTGSSLRISNKNSLKALGHGKSEHFGDAGCGPSTPLLSSRHLSVLSPRSPEACQGSWTSDILLEDENTDNGKHLFPYQLFSARSYCGETEILLGGARQSTLRCESQRAVALVVTKVKVKELQDEFPHLTGAWYEAAVVRERRRAALLQHHTAMNVGRSYRMLALISLQRWWRSEIKMRGSSYRSLGMRLLKVKEALLNQAKTRRSSDDDGLLSPRPASATKTDPSDQGAEDQVDPVVHDAVEAVRAEVQAGIGELRRLSEAVSGASRVLGREMRRLRRAKGTLRRSARRRASGTLAAAVSKFEHEATGQETALLRLPATCPGIRICEL